jgi:hypothetical protein
VAAITAAFEQLAPDVLRELILKLVFHLGISLRKANLLLFKLKRIVIKNLISSSRELIRQKIRPNKFASRK